MPKIDEIEKELESLSRAEKARLLQRIVQDLGDSSSGVESTPGVCGGEPCIVRTRLPVWILEQMRQQGVSEADILRSYPALRAQDLAAAWAYVPVHRAEIEQQMRELDPGPGCMPMKTPRFQRLKNCADWGTTS